MALTLLQTRFVDSYLGEANGNATKAARLAGYAAKTDDCMGQTGYDTLHSPAVQAEIQRRTAAIARASKGKVLSAESLLALLSEQATLEVGDILDADGYPSVDATKKGRAKRHVRRIRETRNGTEIDLLDATKARELLGKYHGLWSDDTVVTVHAAASADALIATVLAVLQDTIPDADTLDHITSTLLTRLAGSTSTSPG